MSQEKNTGKAFEQQIADAYRELGAKKVVRDTKLADNQIDVYVEFEIPGGLHRIAVEAKDWASPVGIAIVNAFTTITNLLRSERLIDEAIIISAVGFSKEARGAAERYHIQLKEIADLEADVARSKNNQAPNQNTPHQLPPPPRDFTGREADIQELLDQIRTGGATISGLRGMGGVGKTALALKLAETLTPDFPNGQFYLDLKGTTQPLSATEAMAHVIRAYQPDRKLPENEAEVLNVYRSILHDKQTILLMDNAATREQVEPLIPPAGSIMIVTSRERFTLPGLYPKNLDTLSPDDARALLLKISPRIDNYADEIAQLCGYLPLALRAAASLLEVTPDLDPADYTASLRDERHRLETIGKEGVDLDVEASFNLSYSNLSDYAKRVFAMLSIFPGSFGAKSEEYVCEDAGHSILSNLVKRSLVEWDEKNRRYHLHDLARLFAASHLDEKLIGKARLYHARHYRDVLAAADELYGKGGDSITKALEIFDTEWPNIRAGQAWAAANIADSDDITDLCSSYPVVGWHLINLRLPPQERISWREKAIAAARLKGDIVAEAAHLGNIGNAYRHIGKLRRAIELHEQALILDQQFGTPQGKASQLNNIGSNYLDLGEPIRAVELHEQALALYRQIGDRSGEAASLSSLGLAHIDSGDFYKAIDFFPGSSSNCYWFR